MSCTCCAGGCELDPRTPEEFGEAAREADAERWAFLSAATPAGSWREDRPSAKQLAVLGRHGYAPPRTKGEASDLIAGLYKRPSGSRGSAPYGWGPQYGDYADEP